MATGRKAVPLSERLMLTVEEAGQLIGVGKTKAYEMVASRELPSVDLNKGVGKPCIRVPRQALDNWVARKIAEAQQSA